MHYILFIYSLFIYAINMYTLFTMHVHSVYTLYTFYIHYKYITYIHYIYALKFIICIYIQCAASCVSASALASGGAWILAASRETLTAP